MTAARASPHNLELTCTTLGGSVAATLLWPDDAPVSGLAQAIVAAVHRSGFTGLKAPLGVWNLRLLRPGNSSNDALPLSLGEDAPSLDEQFGLPEPISP